MIKEKVIVEVVSKFLSSEDNGKLGDTETNTKAVFEMAYLLTAQYTVHTAYYFLKNSV